jgi:hypothetical protein
MESGWRIVRVSSWSLESQTRADSSEKQWQREQYELNNADKIQRIYSS